MTEYLKENGIYNDKIIPNFLRSQRVKYFIGNEPKVVSKSGRHGSFTLFTTDLFDLFVMWLEKKPLPLLNRKEYEVSDFIFSYFSDAQAQYAIDKYFFDWYIPSHDLLIEFNESHYNKPSVITLDSQKAKVLGIKRLFIIHEASVMKDLAVLCKTYPSL